MRVRLALLGALLCTACGGSGLAAQPVSSARDWPLGDLTMRHAGRDAVHLTVEIADTEAHREAGLMNAKDLPRDHGEVFAWTQPVRVAFWMKDTLIPLDIVFWDARGRIVDILSMTPCTADPCAVYNALSSFVAAAELDPGVLQAAGVQVGDTVVLAYRARAVASSSS